MWSVRKEGNIRCSTAAGGEKAFRVEGVFGRLQRVLCTGCRSVCIGIFLGLFCGCGLADVSGDLKVRQHSDIFELASYWKAVLRLGEANVYLRQRSHDHLYNSLVLAFLCKLEYYQGIKSLTSNRAYRSGRGDPEQNSFIC